MRQYAGTGLGGIAFFLMVFGSVGAAIILVIDRLSLLPMAPHIGHNKGIYDCWGLNGFFSSSHSAICPIAFGHRLGRLGSACLQKYHQLAMEFYSELVPHCKSPSTVLVSIN